jgi:hypothetical protein
MSSKQKYNIGNFLSGKKLFLDDKFLEYKNIYGGNFRIPTRDIQSVVVSPHSIGYGKVKLLGKGTELAYLVLPLPWAHSTQDWLMSNLFSELKHG